MDAEEALKWLGLLIAAGLICAGIEIALNRWLAARDAALKGY